MFRDFRWQKGATGWIINKENPIKVTFDYLSCKPLNLHKVSHYKRFVFLDDWLLVRSVSVLFQFETLITKSKRFHLRLVRKRWNCLDWISRFLVSDVSFFAIAWLSNCKSWKLAETVRENQTCHSSYAVSLLKLAKVNSLHTFTF